MSPYADSTNEKVLRILEAVMPSRLSTWITARSLPHTTIRPSDTEGDVLTTVDGYAVWEAPSAGVVAAEDVTIADAAGDFAATDVEGALAELQADAEADATALADHIADAADAHDASAISYNGGTGMSAGDVEAAIDELATEKMNVGGAKLRTPLGFAVAAPAVATTPNVAMSLASGHTAQVIKVRSKIDSGTSVTFSVRQNGVAITGLSGLSATTTAATHAFTAVSVAENDEIDIDITAVSGSPTNLMVTVFLEHSF